MSSGFFSSRHWEVDRTGAGARMAFGADQIAIVFLSPLAIILLAEGGPVAPWGFVVGLIAQPFWILATWRARQLGSFAISVLYVAIWIDGIVNHFPNLLR